MSNSTSIKFRTRLAAMLLLSLFVTACGGGGGSTDGGGTGDSGTGNGGDDGGSTPASGMPAVTDVGDPAAPPSTAVIGPAGGSLTSRDGLLTLTIPAGALTQDTAIGIQPIDNNAPGGLGLAYRLTPDGQTFSAPITLSYAPPGGQPSGSALSQLGAAFQAADGEWQVLNSSHVDEVAGTFAVTTTHFTDYSFFAYLDLQISKPAAFVNQQVKLQIVQYDPVQADDGPVGTTYLPDRSHPHDFSTLTPQWSVDGMAQPGDDTPQGSIVTLSAGTANYMAPAHLPSSGNPVAIGATFMLPEGGPAVTLVKNLHLFAHKYHVGFTVTFSSICEVIAGSSPPATPELDYELDDNTSFDISLDDNFQISGSNFAAMAPGGPFSVTIRQVCTPPGGESITRTATYQEDRTDSMFVSSASGGYMPALDKLRLIVKGGAVTDVPAFHLVYSAAGRTLSEADVPQSRSSADFEYLLLDGRNGEVSPDFPPTPGNPFYDNNVAELTVLEE